MNKLKLVIGILIVLLSFESILRLILAIIYNPSFISIYLGEIFGVSVFFIIIYYIIKYVKNKIKKKKV